MSLSLKNVFLLENKKSNIWYHGSHEDIDTFKIDFTGKGHDQEGPGIYFTNSKKDALQYGPNISAVEIQAKKLVPNKGHVDKKTILHLMRSSPSYKDALSNWDENIKNAENMAFKSIENYNGNPKEVFEAIWYEFYRNDPVDFLKQMTKLGYDGHIVQKNHGVQHLILYNPNVIKHKKHI